jgi:glycosyltransferase involved in cell wall biosynthesis
LISIAVTTYNRAEMTVKSFEKVLDNPNVAEVVIVDDFSNPKTFHELGEMLPVHSKINLYRNQQNLGMSRNKAHAISLCKSDWVCILDSDNVIDNDYVEAFESEENKLNFMIYAPSFARPNFDYRKYEGQTFHRFNVKQFLNESEFSCMINTCNYVVNRDWYAATYRHNPEMKETDTHWFNYCHMDFKGGIKIVSGMEYDHLVHTGSGWMKNAHYNMKQSEKIKQLMAKW